MGVRHHGVLGRCQRLDLGRSPRQTASCVTRMRHRFLTNAAGLVLLPLILSLAVGCGSDPHPLAGSKPSGASCGGGDTGGLLTLAQKTDVVATISSFGYLWDFTTGSGFVLNHVFRLDGVAAIGASSAGEALAGSVEVAEPTGGVGCSSVFNDCCDPKEGESIVVFLARPEGSETGPASRMDFYLETAAIKDADGTLHFLGQVAKQTGGQLPALAAKLHETDQAQLFADWVSEVRSGPDGPISKAFAPQN